jgi:5,10-methylene-tetrahydrofolate dehydrogenase/methenyl tetrahydrofolate cyclohydrolase
VQLEKMRVMNDKNADGTLNGIMVTLPVTHASNENVAVTLEPHTLIVSKNLSFHERSFCK